MHVAVCGAGGVAWWCSSVAVRVYKVCVCVATCACVYDVFTCLRVYVCVKCVCKVCAFVCKVCVCVSVQSVSGRGTCGRVCKVCTSKVCHYRKMSATHLKTDQHSHSHSSPPPSPTLSSAWVR